MKTILKIFLKYKQYWKILNMQHINNINKNISLNNFVSLLKSQKYSLKRINFIPVMINKTSSPTILDIYDNKETLNVKINIFKIKPFTKLQSIYQEYIQNNNDLAIEILGYGLKVLLKLYILDTKALHKFTTKNSYYIQCAPKYTIDNIINNIYKLLSEDYCTVIDYKEKLINIKRKQIVVGDSYVGKSFLGACIPSCVYIINIKIYLISKNQYVINKIKTQIKKIEEKITKLPFKIELEISIENNKKNQIYLSYFNL
ncbi:type VI secretion system baseplate protein IglJ [Francisella tularensis]|uniref:type VI secretion system baseplate protein IglJ n=1 Tax=Francisella tularensis TaxID=263 RepID=UPI0005AD10F0|nr:type VI secretion system baseplate protein IglJ [Francisella tularensis]